MNLIEDAWIPVVTRDGRRFRMTPWQLTDGIDDDPIFMVAAPRPDFTGALLEFLIGLVQTEAAPETERDWAEWKNRPPAPGDLRERLSLAVPHFFLDGDGPRFMQSFDEFEGVDRNIEQLLFDSPGEQTLKKNSDFFKKRNSITGLCQSCISTALYAKNAYACGGGTGYRTSLRGGGPVTSIICPDPERNPELMTLWHRVWSNVVSRRVFFEMVPGNRALSAPEKTYPWLVPTRTSEKGESTTPLDMSPLHVFWGMPERISIDLQNGVLSTCDICGQEGVIFTGYHTKNKGMNYKGAWIHPLTSYSFDDKGQPAPFHMPRGGLGYRNWAALATGRNEQKIRHKPAGVVRAALRDERRVGSRARLIAFGFDFKKAKARGWYEYEVPVYHVAPERIENLREGISDLIVAAEQVAESLRSALRDVWFPERGAKNNRKMNPKRKKIPEEVVSAFWEETEPEFLDMLDRLVEVLGEEGPVTELFHGWHRVICGVSERLFETWAEASDFGEVDPGRVARAHLDLRRFNWKKSIRDALRLPEMTKRSQRKEETDDR